MFKTFIFFRILLGTLKLALVIFFVLFVVIPLAYKFSYKFQKKAVFLNFVNWPKDPDYSNPSKYQLEGARNFYVRTDDDVTLGVWQILPESLAHTVSNTTDDDYFEKVLDNGQHVVVYNHGNSGHRIAPHRLELYKVLRRHFHVIAYDYRSYGDSSDVEPSEDGLVNDAIFMYKWLSNRTSSKIFVWGHSLGTGISTHALSLLKKEGVSPLGLVLECPFTNMMEEVGEHPLAKIFSNLPWFHYTVVEPMAANNLRFENDKYVPEINCPILILHAEDDHVVPYRLGKKLYDSAKEKRSENQGSLSFYGFEYKFHFGHKYICRSSEIDNIISNFIAQSVKEAKEKSL